MTRCEVCGKTLRVYDQTVQIREGVTDPYDVFVPERELMVLHAECFQRAVKTLRD